MDGTITDDQVHAWLQQIADASWVSLHFDTPALGGLDKAEIAGGGYQRFKMAWSQPDGRSIWSLVDARFTGLTQTKVTYFGVWNSLNKGVLLAYTELQVPVQILNGKGFVIPARQIVISMG